MNSGWICLHRRILDSGVAPNSKLFPLFAYLLLNANHEPGYFKGHLIQTGQLATSIKHLSEYFRVARSTVTRWTQELAQDERISLHKTNTHFCIITICNWELYQVKVTAERSQNEHKTNTHVQRLCNDSATTLHTEQQRTSNKEQKEPPVALEQGSSSSGGCSFQFPENLQTGGFAEAWGRWRRHLNGIHHVPSQEAVAEWLARCADWGEANAIQAIHHSISRGWKFIDQPPEWDTQVQNSNGDDQSEYRLRQREEYRRKVDAERKQAAADRHAILEDIRKQAGNGKPF